VIVGRWPESCARRVRRGWVGRRREVANERMFSAVRAMALWGGNTEVGGANLHSTCGGEIKGGGCGWMDAGEIKGGCG
jgi:hypothetical protein